MKKAIAIIVLGLLWCSTSFAGLDTLAELDKELIRLGSNSVEHNLECTVPPKAAKKDWSTIIYKVGTSTMNNKLFAHKWWPPFEKYEVVSSRAIVTPMDNDVAKSQTMWFFLGVSAKAKEAGKRQSIRKHLMLELTDGSGEYMLFTSEVEISKEDIDVSLTYDSGAQYTFKALFTPGLDLDSDVITASLDSDDYGHLVTQMPIKVRLN